MMNGEPDVVSGWRKRLMLALASITPAGAPNH